MDQLEIQSEKLKLNIFIDQKNEQVVVSGTEQQLVDFYKRWKKDLPPHKEITLDGLVKQEQDMGGTGQRMLIGKADDFCLDETKYDPDETVLVLVSNIDDFQNLIEENKNIL